MSQIPLAFAPEMEAAILEGRKCCTCRHTAHGKPGDTFVIRDTLYRIVDIRPGGLNAVTRFYFRSEGFTNPIAFCQFWEKTYRRPYNPEEQVYIHFFAAVIDPRCDQEEA